MQDSKALRYLTTLFAMLCFVPIAGGEKAMIIDKTTPLSRYVYIGSIGGKHVIWMTIEPSNEQKQEEELLKRSIIGKVRGEYRYFSTGDADYLELQGEVGADGRFVMTEHPRSFGSPSNESVATTGQFKGRFKSEFREADGEWVSANRKRHLPFRLRRVARYEQHEVTYTIQETCDDEEPGDCMNRVAGTDQCRNNTDYLSRYPVWENPEYEQLNEFFSNRAIIEFDPPLDDVKSKSVPFDPAAPYLNSTYDDINVLFVSSDAVSYASYSSHNACGAAHPSNFHAIGSLARDSRGKFMKVELEQVIAPEQKCRAALRQALMALGAVYEEGAEKDAERYGSFALMPSGISFLYNIDHASGGYTKFLPYKALPAGCVLLQSPVQGHK